MKDEKDILLGSDDDIDIVNGDFVIGDSVLQEVGVIIRLNSGELKSDPILAPNMIQLIHAKKIDDSFEYRLRLQLERDGKDFDEIKGLININYGNN